MHFTLPNNLLMHNGPESGLVVKTLQRKQTDGDGTGCLMMNPSSLVRYI